MVHNEANVPSNDDHLYNRNDYLCGCTVVLRIINRSLFTSDWNRFINSNHIQYVFINLSSPSAWGGYGYYWSRDYVRSCNRSHIIRNHCGTSGVEVFIYHGDSFRIILDSIRLQILSERLRIDQA